MKKLFLLLALFGVVALTNVNAQSCAKKTASCAATCAKKAAAKMASMDENIEARVSAVSGETTYVKKSVCTHSGNVSFDQVEYCTKAGKFVNISPSKVAAPAKTCTKSATTAKSVNASNKKMGCTAAQKAKCAKTCTAAEKAACKANKGATIKNAEAPSNTGTVKLVKMEGEK